MYLAPNPFRKVVTALILMNTIWSLIFIFLSEAGALLRVIPEHGDEGAGGGAGAFGMVCGVVVLAACFLPLIFALVAAGRSSWLVMGCAACWLSSLLWIGGIGAYPFVVLYFLPLPSSTTVGLGFLWLYERSRTDLEKKPNP